MEQTLDLKMPGVMELGKEELKVVDGGTAYISYLTIRVLVEIDQFMQGFVDGFKENKT